ncbi:MAG: YceI family protein, partial [Myxococcota bacterium]
GATENDPAPGSADTGSGAGDSPVDVADGTGTTPSDDVAEAPLLSANFAGSSSLNGKNSLYVLVYKKAGSGGHDHVVRSPNFTGNLTYRVGAIADCSVNVTVPVAALLNDENEMRERVGLADISGDWGWSLGGGRDKVNENMLAKDQLDAAGHPNIRFTSTVCRGNAGTSGTILVDGELTLRGVTRNVTWSVDVDVTGDRLQANGSLQIKQSDYGITPYKLFNFENADAVDLVFDLDVNG